MRFVLALLAVLFLSGCDHIYPVVSTGPVKIVLAQFDYHQTIEYPNGHQIDFHHCLVDTRLFEEGATVDIVYRGDPEQVVDPWCPEILSVKIITHSPDYITKHPELWPPRKGHWDGDSYFLDETREVCGEVTDLDGLFSAYANGDNARHHEYVKVKTKAEAKAHVEEDCK